MKPKGGVSAVSQHSLILCASMLSCMMVALVNGYWFSYLFPIDPYDMRRVIELVFLIAIPLLSYGFHEVRENFFGYLRFLPKGVRQAWILFFGLGAMSALYAAYPQFAFLEWALYLLILLDLLMLAAWATALKAWGSVWLYGTLMASIYVLIIGRLVLYGLYGHALRSGATFDSMVFITPTFMQLRFLAQVMTWTWPILVLPLMASSSMPRVKGKVFVGKVLIFILSGFLWSVMILNHSRALYLEWVGLMSIALIFFSKPGRTWCCWQLGVALLGLLIYFVQYQVIVNLYFLHLPLWGSGLFSRSLQSFSMVDNRLVLYHAAWLLIQAHPILGVGPLHYPEASWAFQQSAAHPHDVWLLVACEWGIPAFLCFFSVVSFGMWKLFVKTRSLCQGSSHQKASSFEGMILFLTLMGGLFHASVSGVLVMPASQGLLVWVVGWSVYFYFNKPHQDPSNKNNKRMQILMGLAFLLAIGLIIWGVWPMWGRWTQAIEIYLDVTHLQMLEPNFWLQGWIQFY